MLTCYLVDGFPTNGVHVFSTRMLYFCAEVYPAAIIILCFSYDLVFCYLWHAPVRCLFSLFFMTHAYAQSRARTHLMLAFYRLEDRGSLYDFLFWFDSFWHLMC